MGSADRLCKACADLLEVDGAALSVVRDGTVHGTLGASGALSRRLDELQFTFGEGPCLEAVRTGQPVLVKDLAAAEEQRWPALAEAMLEAGVRGLAAMPVMIAASSVGALDLFSSSVGSLSDTDLSGARWAAQLAALPVLDLIDESVDWDQAVGSEDGWTDLAPSNESRSTKRQEWSWRNLASEQPKRWSDSVPTPSLKNCLPARSHGA
jgi:hypothetical protein